MVGQINRGDKLGDLIYNLCNQEDIKVIVDIGTWNGMGSTKCIYDSIIENKKTDYLVYSIESNESFYNQAVNNLNSKIENFNLILGRLVEIDELIDVDTCDNKFFTSSSREVQKTWMLEDSNNYSNIKNVLDIIPEKIDLLILDGGEFSSLSEFNKLKERTTYFILDDTNTIKNYEVANLIRSEVNNYEIFMDSNDRNGFLVAKKIK